MPCNCTRAHEDGAWGIGIGIPCRASSRTNLRHYRRDRCFSCRGGWENTCKNIPGVTGKVFEALGRNGINPRAIAYGSSERILVWVLSQNDLKKSNECIARSIIPLPTENTEIYFLSARAWSAAHCLNFSGIKKTMRRQRCGVHNQGSWNCEQPYNAFWWKRELDLPMHNLFKSQRQENLILSFHENSTTGWTLLIQLLLIVPEIESTVQQYLPLFNSSVFRYHSSKVRQILYSYDFL